jgi:predicted CXXCH cytochrome family protein
MKLFYKSILIVTVIFIVLPFVSFAQGDAGCVTSKCHETISTKQFVHGPVGAGICTICHTPVKGKKHQFTFSAEKDELCFNCHDESRDMMLEDHLHTPVADGNCVGCHDPHQSNFKFTLKGSAKELCYNCHNKEKFTMQFVHGPVAVGDCNACHNPHASANDFQLMAEKDKVCYVCHPEQEEVMNRRHLHKPVGESCINCHDAHSNNAKFLLPDDPPNLCYKCHDNIASYADVPYKHEPVDQGNCKQCHDPHASEFPKLFPKAQQDLCMSCHEELKEYVDDQDHKHGPVKEGDCNACHDPHGAQFVKNLRKYFPPEFYKPYTDENYAICFECHNKTVALEEKTKTLTDFRDGEINLHFLHVNKDVKGRSCKACHQVHASSQFKHIRTSVPFGKMNWELPVTYTKYADGGKCVVGCHAPKEYHRK